MKDLIFLFVAALALGTLSFEITDEFYFPPNEIIDQIIVDDNYGYALMQSSNPATIYKIDLDSMKHLDTLKMPYFMQPRTPILDKVENSLYVVARNSSSDTITENLMKIDLNTFKVTSIAYLSAITSLGCDQLFKAGAKFYCMNQYQSSCTIIRIDAATFTPEATNQQYCQSRTTSPPPSLVTPDNQYAYLGYATSPDILSLANMTVQPLPYARVKPYSTQQQSPANMQMCATPDMSTLYMRGSGATSFVRVNVTSNTGNGEYYVEQGRFLTACIVSPDSKYVFSGYSDGSVRRADALASPFPKGYTGVLHQFDSPIQGFRMLGDQNTVLVWTTHQMLKFAYNDNMNPISPQILALEQNFLNIVGMAVDREEKFAYLYAWNVKTYTSKRPFETYVIKYDLQQRSIALVANTTATIEFRSDVQIFLNANQNQLLVISDYAHILSTDDLSVLYSNRNVYVAGNADYFQDPSTSEVVIVRSSGFITYNIDTNTTCECSIPSRGDWKHVISGPGNQVWLVSATTPPDMVLADRTTCALKIITPIPSGLTFSDRGAFYQGSYYLLAHNRSGHDILFGYNLAAPNGNFSQVATYPYMGIIKPQLSFKTRDSYVMPRLDSYLLKLNLQTLSVDQLQLFAESTTSCYNYKTNTAYILIRTEPPSIVKISV